MSETLANKNVLLIKRLYLFLHKNKTKWLSKFDITATQFDILVFLFDNRESGEINQKTVEEHLMVSNPAVSGVIKRLQEKKLISCKQSTIDARNKSLSLTQKSLDYMESIIKIGRYTLEDNLIHSMSEEEADEFHRLLAKALHNLEKMKDE